MRPIASLQLIVGLLLIVGQSGSRPLGAAEAKTSGADLFGREPHRVLRLRLKIAPAELARLKASPRAYVAGDLTEEGGRHYGVHLHIKGRTGSFQPLDQKPSFTLRFGSTSLEQRFHGIEKIHLNNSAEDPTYLHELLGSELFNAAGIPAARVAHAMVELNGRSLGLYVLKEGFTEEFVHRHFPGSTGRLYEPATGQEIVDPMEEKFAVGQPTVDLLAGIQAMSRDTVSAELQLRFRQTVDVERFHSFVALEVLLAHRDGYSIARNNFRLWEDTTEGRLVFLPHGMDQLFGSSPSILEPQMGGLMARVLMETPGERNRYRARLGLLYTNLFDPARLHQGIDRVSASLRTALPRRAARELDAAILVLKGSIARRHELMGRLLQETELRPLSFVNGLAALGGWEKVDEPAGGRMREMALPGGGAALLIEAGPRTAASWRTKVRLGPGRYRFEGKVAVRGFRPLEYGRLHGAALRIWREPPVLGREARTSADGPPLSVEFSLLAEETVVLACEFRAAAGEARFDSSTLGLVRLSEE